MSIGMRRAFTAIAAAAAAGLMAMAMATGSVAMHQSLADHIAHDPGGVPYSNGVINTDAGIQGSGIVTTDSNGVINADHQPTEGGG